MTDKELRSRFVAALDDELPPPAPGLAARVLDVVSREQRPNSGHQSGPTGADWSVRGTGRRGHVRWWNSQAVQPPRWMALVAALLAVAMVMGLVFASRALHPKSSIPAGHQFARAWSLALTSTYNVGAIAFTTDGFVLLIDRSSGSIVKLRASDGSESLRWGSLGSGPGQFTTPFHIAVDAENNVYATDHLAGKVLKFDENGNFLREWSTETFGVNGIGVDARDRIYVANSGTHDHYVQVFTPDGRLVNQFGQTGTGAGEFWRNMSDQGGPSTIVVEPSGSVWVTDWESGRLYHFGSDGQLLLQAGAGTPLLSQLHFKDVFPGLNGHVYADDGANIHEVDASGRDLGVFDPGKYGLPNHTGYYPIPLADSNGNLYVFDLFNSTLTKLSRQ